MEQREGIDGEVVEYNGMNLKVERGSGDSCLGCEFSTVNCYCHRVCKSTGIDCDFDEDNQIIFVKQ